MILFSAGDIRSCKYNAAKLFKKVDEQLEKEKEREKDRQQPLKEGTQRKEIDKQYVYSYVNIGLLLVKCHMLESRNEHAAVDILIKCKRRLEETVAQDIKEVKKRLQDVFKDRLDQLNTGNKGE